ncbi:hypothetical protein, partial [uncultured Parabacteroides sp.]|uniref:hypothetical protein n=1 Tax=uncultured Parabacteroides sp. TaxID=512312 RepID=UPI00263A48BD
FFLLFSADNREKKNPASVILTGFCFFFRRLFVELEGTRLYLFFVLYQSVENRFHPKATE